MYSSRASPARLAPSEKFRNRVSGRGLVRLGAGLRDAVASGDRTGKRQGRIEREMRLQKMGERGAAAMRSSSRPLMDERSMLAAT